MAKPTSTLTFHPRRAEIDAALDQGQPIRAVAATFGVSRSALHRYAAGRSVQPGAKSVSTLINGQPPSPARFRPDPTRISPPGDPFDLTDVHYPWAPGEIPTPDPMAAQLRSLQRRFGTAAVRTDALALIGMHAGLSDHVLARKLDVPPSRIAAWRAEEERELLASLDPRSLFARELMAIKRRVDRANYDLANPNISDKARASCNAVLNRCTSQKLALFRQAGLALAPPAPAQIPIDERRLDLVLNLKADLASFMAAAGIPLDTSMDDAVAQLPAALDDTLGPLGSPEREAANAQLKDAFRRGRASWSDDEEK